MDILCWSGFVANDASFSNLPTVGLITAVEELAVFDLLECLLTGLMLSWNFIQCLAWSSTRSVKFTEGCRLDQDKYSCWWKTKRLLQLYKQLQLRLAVRFNSPHEQAIRKSDWACPVTYSSLILDPWHHQGDGSTPEGSCRCVFSSSPNRTTTGQCRSCGRVKWPCHLQGCTSS